VRAAYLDLTGQPVTGSVAEPAAGRSFLVESYDPLSAVSYWRSGELGLRNWLSASRTADETAWFARDDLRPFELMCIRMGWRMLSRPVASRVRVPWPRPAPDPEQPAVPRLRRGRGKPGRR
jgi:D-aspartate ligase